MSEEIIGAVGRRKEAVARVYIRPGDGKTVVKTIYVPGKLVNIVVK